MVDKKNCEHLHTRTIKKQETFAFRGEDLKITSLVKECTDCGKELNDPALTNETLKSVYAAYKKQHGLLASEEIVALRQKYGLSQRAFAKLLGCTQATIVRYERGSVQDLSNDRAMRMMQQPRYVRQLLAEGKVELSIKEKEKLEKRLALLEQDTVSNDSADEKALMLLSDLEIKPNEYNGFVRFDFQKVAGMVRYFASNQNHLYKTKLMKLLWYSDMLFCQEHLRSISGMRYVHQYYGPIPVKHEMLLALLVELGYITTQEDEYGETIELSEREPDASFSDEEMMMLQRVSKKFAGYTAKAISEHSHQEEGYKNTAKGDEISFAYALQMATP